MREDNIDRILDEDTIVDTRILALGQSWLQHNTLLDKALEQKSKKQKKRKKEKKKKPKEEEKSVDTFELYCKCNTLYEQLITFFDNYPRLQQAQEKTLACAQRTRDHLFHLNRILTVKTLDNLGRVFKTVETYLEILIPQEPPSLQDQSYERLEHIVQICRKRILNKELTLHRPPGLGPKKSKIRKNTILKLDEFSEHIRQAREYLQQAQIPELYRQYSVEITSLVRTGDDIRPYLTRVEEATLGTNPLILFKKGKKVLNAGWAYKPTPDFCEILSAKVQTKKWRLFFVKPINKIRKEEHSISDVLMLRHLSRYISRIPGVEEIYFCGPATTKVFKERSEEIDGITVNNVYRKLHKILLDKC